MKRILHFSPLLLALPILNVYAATPIDLAKQNPNRLPSLLSVAPGNNTLEIKETQRELDSLDMLHIRMQQTYRGYPVWGDDAVANLKQATRLNALSLPNVLTANANTTMNGIMYQNLQQDLANDPEKMFGSANAQKAIEAAIANYQEQVHAKLSVENSKSQLMVYVDDENKAHWSYRISFRAPATKASEPPAIPTYIMDATTFRVYLTWNDMKTNAAELENVAAGGFGGNLKSGKLIYDGLANHMSSLTIQRDAATQKCHYKNADIMLYKCDALESRGECMATTAVERLCQQTDPAHNNVYWNGDSDAVNGGYSPSNDALYNGDVTKKMYNNWVGMPVLKNYDGSPMVLAMVVHLQKFDNAYWDGHAMYFGDGDKMFYPLTSLGITAHEVSHGFTQQHSNLQYVRQSGAMNESFSDMAAKAAEFYAYGKNLNWDLAPETFKQLGKALRYMDRPSKDCGWRWPGFMCSIDNAAQYNDWLNVHYTSGVYNRFFYILSTSPNWDTKKAFQVMARANAFYWTSTTNFVQGACGVLSAATDLGHDTNAIKSAFNVVKVDTSHC
ncbi:MAG: M4 family metallopeptidase [Gammaproteobacteria bacterium]